MTNQSRLSSNFKVPLSGLLYSLSLFEHCSLSFSLILSECVLQSPFFSSFLLSTSFHVPGIYSLCTCFLKLITLSLNASLNVYFTFCQCLHVYLFLSKLLLCGYEIWTPTVYILSPVAKYLKAISTWFIAGNNSLWWSNITLAPLHLWWSLPIPRKTLTFLYIPHHHIMTEMSINSMFLVLFVEVYVKQ